MKTNPLQIRVLNMLRAIPEARERRQKDYYLVKLLTSHWSSGNPSINALVDLVRDYNSADRFWRKSLEENESLRGRDYGDKVKYEQKKQIELGMESGYHEVNRKLKQT